MLTLIVSFVLIGVGPRTLGRQHAESIALKSTLPVVMLTKLLGPLPKLLILLGNAVTPGKGFSEEVEKEYRKSNANLDYAWINRMETIRISPRQMENFIEDGRLVLRGEGGRP